MVTLLLIFWKTPNSGHTMCKKAICNLLHNVFKHRSLKFRIIVEIWDFGLKYHCEIIEISQGQSVGTLYVTFSKQLYLVSFLCFSFVFFCFIVGCNRGRRVLSSLHASVSSSMVGLSVTNMLYQLELARHYVLDKHVNWQLDYQGCGGRRMEVLWSPQWPLNGRYWRSNINTMLTKVCIFYGATNDRPLCIPWPWRCACLPSVSFEWTVSDQLPWWPLWTCSKIHSDHGVHGGVWTSCVLPLNDQDSFSASFMPSAATWPVLRSHKGSAKAQCKGRNPCVKVLKGGIMEFSTHCHPPACLGNDNTMEPFRAAG